MRDLLQKELPMSNDDEDRRTALFVPAIACALVMILTFYPFSIGPATWIDNRFEIPHPVRETLVAFYSPIAWLCEECDPIEKAIGWYLDLWE